MVVPTPKTYTPEDPLTMPDGICFLAFEPPSPE
jgi:hypothetical protein